MIKVFDSIVIATLHTGNKDIIPPEYQALRDDVETLSQILAECPSSPLVKPYSYYGHDTDVPLPKKLKEIFKCLSEFDIAVEIYQSDMDARNITSGERRIDTLRALARQYIRPVEIEL